MVKKKGWVLGPPRYFMFYLKLGYITDLQVVKGSGVTSSTVPTAPVSASGTTLALSFTNGAIIDNAMMNNLETVGNAQISTSVLQNAMKMKLNKDVCLKLNFQLCYKNNN